MEVRLNFYWNEITFRVNDFVIIYACDLLNLSLVKINSVQFKISDPVAKINSEKLAGTGYVNRENFFSKNHLVWSISLKAKINTFWKLTSQNSRHLRLLKFWFLLFIYKQMGNGSYCNSNVSFLYPLITSETSGFWNGFNRTSWVKWFNWSF